MNRRQRKFFKALADLMQEHNVRMETVKPWLGDKYTVWNISGDVVTSEEVELLKVITPSNLRKAINKSEEV